MIGHHARFRENDDLPLWQGPATKKKPPFCNARALITRKIVRSRDAQCNTGNNLKDVRANWYCASLLRTQIHMPRHASSARTKY